jgi:formylmethanofuran dehydrogenase subunit B
MPKGLFVPEGHKGRTVVLVDVRWSKSAPAADIFLQVKPRMDFEALWALRALVKGVELVEAACADIGIPLEQLKDLARRMKECKFGILFFGMGLSMTRGRHLNVEAALSLARDLNEYTRFYAKPMRGHGNVTGADNVVSWQTGYPFGVNPRASTPASSPRPTRWRAARPTPP